jgi:chloramphenicol O-acetyltransferase
LEDDVPLGWEDKLAELRETLQDFGKNAQVKIEKMESVTREHPKTALTTAFLAGVTIGALVFAALSLSMRRNPDRE